MEPSSLRRLTLSLRTDGTSFFGLGGRWGQLGLSSAATCLRRLEERSGEGAPPSVGRGLAAGGSAGEEVGHHLPFALDRDHASVLQRVVVGAQNLLQVGSHLRAEEASTQANVANAVRLKVNSQMLMLFRSTCGFFLLELPYDSVWVTQKHKFLVVFERFCRLQASASSISGARSSFHFREGKSVFINIFH